MAEINEGTLQDLYSELEKVEKKYLELAKQIMEAGDRKMYTMDIFTLIICNRAMSIIRGFVKLGQDNNYITSVPLIRLQVDNCLKFFASTIVSDYDDFILCFLTGEETKDYKDHSGKKLFDSYLTRKLDKLYPGIRTLYKNTSGYIHLSNAHTIVRTESDWEIKMKVGEFDNYSIGEKIDFVYNMLCVSNILLSLLDEWRIRKDGLTSLPEQNPNKN